MSKKKNKAKAAAVRWEDTPGQRRPAPKRKPNSIEKYAEKASIDSDSDAFRKTLIPLIIAMVLLGFVASFIVANVALVQGS